MSRPLRIAGQAARILMPSPSGWITVLGDRQGGGYAPPPPTDVTADDRADLVFPRRAPVPPSGPVRNVTTLGSQTLNRATIPADGSVTSLTKHVLTVDVTSIRLAWEVTGGWFTAESGGTYRMWIEGAGLTAPLPLTFGGASSVTVEPPSAGARTYTTDPVAVSWIAGDRITVGVEVVAAAGTTVPADSTGRRAGVDPELGEASIRPSRIEAASNKTAWVVIGDSIAQQPYSYGEQALARKNLAAVKSAIGGDGYGYWNAGAGGVSYTNRVSRHAPYATHLMDTLGMNDRSTTNALATWRYIRRNSSLRIVKTTVNPDSKDRDFATTTSSREPSRHQFNEWLRDGAPILADWSAPLPTGSTDPNAVRCTVVSYDGSTVTTRNQGHVLDAVSDAAAAVEQSRTNPVYSDEALALIGAGDSLHPAPGVHKLMAERIMADLTKLGH